MNSYYFVKLCSKLRNTETNDSSVLTIVEEEIGHQSACNVTFDGVPTGFINIQEVN